MKEEEIKKEVLEKVEEEILETSEALFEYDGYKHLEGSEYEDGWKDAIDQFVLELLGRKSEDGAKLLRQAIENEPTATKEMAEK